MSRFVPRSGGFPTIYPHIVDLALMTEPQVGGTYKELRNLAQWAEQRGLVSFARSDHYYSTEEPAPDATDAYATLAGLARDTESIRLCVLVSPISFRHPAVIAKNALTIDQMSGGRFDLGVGTGWMDEEHDAFGIELWPMHERFARFEDALGYLQAAFGSQPARYDGSFYQLRADVKPTPTGALPLIVGGTGKRRTPTLAGRFANEYNQSPAPVSVLAENVATMREAAEAAGRDPDGVLPSVMGSVLVAPDETTLRDRLNETAAQRAMDPSELEELFVGRGIPFGTADRAQSLLGSWLEAGIRRFYVRHFELDDLGLLDEKITALGG